MSSWRKISIHYKDKDFDDFFTLDSTASPKEKDTLKIGYVPHTVVLTLSPVTGPLDSSETLNEPIRDDSLSDNSSDTIDVPSYTDIGMHKLWPAEFTVTSFSYNLSYNFKEAMKIMKKMDLFFCKEKFYLGIKSDILEHLAELMFSYTAYPSDAQRLAVAEALTTKHSCLKEPGSFSGL